MQALVLLDGATMTSAQYVTLVCSNTAVAIKNIGSYLLILFGVVLIVMAVMNIVKGLWAMGKAAWLMIFGSLLFGGFLTFGGLTNVIGNMGRVGKDTLDTIIDNMQPTTTAPIKASGDATFGMDAAKNAIGVLSDNFFVPFAQAAALSVGVLLIILAVAQVWKYFKSAGKGQVSLGKVAVMAVIGSVLFTATPTDTTAGWNWIVNKAVGMTRDTIVGAAECTMNNRAPDAVSSNWTPDTSVDLTVSNTTPDLRVPDAPDDLPV